MLTHPGLERIGGGLSSCDEEEDIKVIKGVEALIESDGKESEEECDDGNLVAGDGCSPK